MNVLNSPSMEVIPKWVDAKILSRLGLDLADRLWFKIAANALSVFAILKLIWNLTKRFRRVNHWNLKGKVAVVTGASRGVGKGIAIALGEAGAIVYVTARTLDKKDTEQAKNDPNRHRNDINPILPGSIMETVQIIKERGGIAIPVQCDCSDDDQIKALFEKVEKEQGRLDILVNNAINIRTDIKQTPPFWNQPIEIWDAYHGVGLRNHYVASVYGVPLMLKSKDSTKLVVNISSPGAKNYMFNVAYGSAKAALDKMSHDMAVELKKQDIVCVGMWPGLVKTERMLTLADNFKRLYNVDVQSQGETPEFTGRAICALYSDPHAMKHAGKILDVVNLSHEYNFTDVDGRQPPQMLTVRFYLETAYYMMKNWLGKKQQ